MHESPTGRWPSEPEMQELRPRQAVIPIVCGMDFATVELLILAAVADSGVSTILLDIETVGERGIEIPGHADLLAMIQPKEAAPVKPQPSYLRHDPSKRGYGRGRQSRR